MRKLLLLLAMLTMAGCTTPPKPIRFDITPLKGNRIGAKDGYAIMG